MFEKMFKGMFVLTVWGFILVAIAALLPDSAWEKFPEKLTPVRDFLAEKNIISSQFRADNRNKAVAEQKNSPLPDTAKESTGPSPLPTPLPESVATVPKPAIPPYPGTADKKQLALAGETSSRTGGLPKEPGTPPLIPSDPQRVSEREKLPELALAPGNQSVKAPLAREHENVFTPTAAVPDKDSKKRNVPLETRSGKDTLPELTFDDKAKNEPTLPEVKSPLVIDTASLERSSVAAPATDRQAPTKKEEEKPIGNASIPDPGAISTTSAISTTPSPFPTIQTTGATGSVPTAIPPVTPQAVQGTMTPSPIVPEVNPSRELAEALALSGNPNEVKAAFFKLNQLLDRYGESFSGPELNQLHKALDRMAFNVFYNPKQHILEPEYIVGAGETLASIANAYKITPELLAALNGLNANTTIQQGSKLKVVRGPVTASVSMSKKELLLLFDGLYAGRFKMGCAANARALRGILSITRKVVNPQYAGPLDNGTQGEIAGGDPRNPLGPCWIELNNGLGLQGTNRPELIGNETAQHGGLIFSNKDISHLNIILPTGANIYLKD